MKRLFANILQRRCSINLRRTQKPRWFRGSVPLALIALLLSPLETGAVVSPWSSSGLSWGDFQGTPPPLSSNPSENYDAFVYTEILWDFNWDPNTQTLEFNAQAVFDHSVSWYRPATANPTLLTHEIAHFDYAEVHARQFKQTISESVELKELLRRCDVTEAEIDALLSQYHSQEIDELNFINEFYDSETDHGQNLSLQNAFTNITIPGLLNSLSAHADPEGSVTVLNEGLEPIPGDYQGTLNYTIQGGPNSASFGEWNWTLQGQWSFSFSANDTGGVSSWTHSYLNNQTGGHLLTATTPSVPAFPNILVTVQGGANGSHYWLDFSGTSTTTIPSHDLTFEPVTNIPSAPAISPGNTTIPFSNGAALALGNWMREHGTPALKMKAPITCPDESIQYVIDAGAGQSLTLDWTLTRIANPQESESTGGSGGSGTGSTPVTIASIEWDSSLGTATINWASSASETTFLIEASEDLLVWNEIGSVVSASAGMTSFIDEDALAETTIRFYRVLPVIL